VDDGDDGDMKEPESIDNTTQDASLLPGIASSAPSPGGTFFSSRRRFGRRRRPLFPAIMGRPIARLPFRRGVRRPGHHDRRQSAALSFSTGRRKMFPTCVLCATTAAGFEPQGDGRYPMEGVFVKKSGRRPARSRADARLREPLRTTSRAIGSST
jgi:hypothetical protein